MLRSSLVLSRGNSVVVTVIRVSLTEELMDPSASSLPVPCSIRRLQD